MSEMANRFFEGSVKSMVLTLINSKQISAADLAELREAIDSLEKSA
jgi:predicted transcriptional regulator